MVNVEVYTGQCIKMLAIDCVDYGIDFLQN